MKPVTFEEWWNGFSECDLNWTVKRKVEFAWDAAREHMVPEDECVQLPKLEEWPEDHDIVGIVVGYDCNGQSVHEQDEGKDYYKLIKYIPRPTPGWTPKVGDPVFYRNTSAIYMIDGIDGEWATMKGRPDSIFNKSALKPASIDKIGKPWEEI